MTSLRRIIKHQNVATADDFFLLEDLPLSFPHDDDTNLPCSESAPLAEDATDDSDFSDTTSSKDYAGNPDVHFQSSRSTAKDIAMLHELRDQIIAQATLESTRLIQEGHARAQAEYQSAISRAKQEIENARQAAIEQGKKEAYEKHASKITDCIARLEEGIARIEGAQAGFINGYENDLKWMALEIAQKILMDTISADEARLVPLVMAAVNSAKNAPWISVEISENMTCLLAQLQQELQSLPFAGKVSLKLVSASDDTCLIETPDRCFDASLTRQIENLKGYFTAEQG